MFSIFTRPLHSWKYKKKMLSHSWYINSMLVQRHNIEYSLKLHIVCFQYFYCTFICTFSSLPLICYFYFQKIARNVRQGFVKMTVPRSISSLTDNRKLKCDAVLFDTGSKWQNHLVYSSIYLYIYMVCIWWMVHVCSCHKK